MSPVNLDNFSKSTNWPKRFSLSADTKTIRKEGPGETSFSFRRQMINNQITAKDWFLNYSFCQILLTLKRIKIYIR